MEIETRNRQSGSTAVGSSTLSDDIEEVRGKVISYKIEFPIESVVQQIDDGIINLQSINDRPIYQQEYFWNDAKASRLIESILLNVPIPSSYFTENKDANYDIIYGQQRILSLYRYLKDEFELTGLETLPSIENLTYRKLPVRLQRLICKDFLPCIVISVHSNPQVKFDIFERLNSDNTPLNAQELRSCIYRSDFNDMLRELAAEDLWLNIRNKKKPDNRMADEELILRFFAFLLQERSEYEPPLKHWLNNTAHIGSKLKVNKLKELRKIWHETLNKSLEWFEPEECFRRPNAKELNDSLFDLITYTARKSDFQTIRNSKDEFRKRYKKLMKSDEFSQLLTGTLDSSESTLKMINLWESEFADLGL